MSMLEAIGWASVAALAMFLLIVAVGAGFAAAAWIAGRITRGQE